jgi:polysaccharide deacetylase family protein (PEP-CTERM system associated)
MPKTILISIDVEDWFQVENLRSHFPPSSWKKQVSRVEKNTLRLLDLFDRCSNGFKATFFVLGWIADRHPQLVREIHDRGHEVASHGNSHLMCTEMEPAELENDLKKSKEILEGITGKPVIGFRAPNFSISDRILPLIEAAGYQYDSSYNNFTRHQRYGSLSTDNFKKKGIAFQINPDFHEIPISNMQLGSTVIPWGGGGYFRFFPTLMFHTGVQRILSRKHAYMFYLHPWEIDPDQPTAPPNKRMSNWKHYLNLDKTLGRLERLLERFGHCSFMTCSQYLKMAR